MLKATLCMQSFHSLHDPSYETEPQAGPSQIELIAQLRLPCRQSNALRFSTRRLTQRLCGFNFALNETHHHFGMLAVGGY